MSKRTVPPKIAEAQHYGTDLARNYLTNGSTQADLIATVLAERTSLARLRRDLERATPAGYELAPDAVSPLEVTAAMLDALEQAITNGTVYQTHAEGRDHAAYKADLAERYAADPDIAITRSRFNHIVAEAWLDGAQHATGKVRVAE